MKLYNIILYIFHFLKKNIVDPAFRLMRFPLDGELDFYIGKMIFMD